MLSGYIKLKPLNMNNNLFSLNKVVDMSCMFNNCKLIQELDITENVQDILTYSIITIY